MSRAGSNGHVWAAVNARRAAPGHGQHRRRQKPPARSKFGRVSALERPGEIIRQPLNRGAAAARAALRHRPQGLVLLGRELRISQFLQFRPSSFACSRRIPPIQRSRSAAFFSAWRAGPLSPPGMQEAALREAIERVLGDGLGLEEAVEAGGARGVALHHPLGHLVRTPCGRPRRNVLVGVRDRQPLGEADGRVLVTEYGALPSCCSSPAADAVMSSAPRARHRRHELVRRVHRLHHVEPHDAAHVGAGAVVAERAHARVGAKEVERLGAPQRGAECLAVARVAALGAHRATQVAAGRAPPSPWRPWSMSRATIDRAPALARATQSARPMPPPAPVMAADLAAGSQLGMVSGECGVVGAKSHKGSISEAQLARFWTRTQASAVLDRSPTPQPQPQPQPRETACSA